MRRLTSIILYAVLVSAAVIAIGMSKEDTVRLRLGASVIELPARLLQNAPPGWLAYLRGLDTSARSVILEIDAAEVTKHVNGYMATSGNAKEKLRIILTSLNSAEIERYVKVESSKEAWRGTGGFKNRVVNKDQSTGLFFVYRSADFPRSWEVFKTDPRTHSEQDLPFSWAASCLILGKNQPPSAACNSYTLYNNLAADFTVSDKNLLHIDAIKSYVNQLLQDWSGK